MNLLKYRFNYKSSSIKNKNNFKIFIILLFISIIILVTTFNIDVDYYTYKDKDKYTINDYSFNIKEIENKLFNSAIMVLGYQLNSNGSPNKILIDRTLKAVSIYKNQGFNSSLFIVSGKSRDLDNDKRQIFKSEAEAIQYIAIKNGVNRSDIYFENQSQSTITNALYSLNKIQSLKIQKLYIITSDYHKLRCQFIFESIYPPDIELTFITANTSKRIRNDKLNSEREYFSKDQKYIENYRKTQLSSIAIEPRWRMIEREFNFDESLNQHSKLLISNYGLKHSYFSMEIAKKYSNSMVYSFNQDEIGERNKTYNIYECKYRPNPIIFYNLIQENVIYDYQISLLYDMGLSNGHDKKEFNQVLFNHLINSKTTFIELPESKKYNLDELKYLNGWNGINGWYKGRSEEEIFKDLNNEYGNIASINWKIIGATSNGLNINKLIRVDVEFKNYKLHSTLSNPFIIDNTYNCK